MPTPQKRWPNNAEAARQEAIELAQDIQRLVKEARKKVRDNPELSEIILADISGNAKDIELLLERAKNGA